MTTIIICALGQLDFALVRSCDLQCLADEFEKIICESCKSDKVRDEQN